MKTRTILPALLLIGFFLNAAEFTISNADVKTVIDTRGGTLKKLSLNGKELIPLSAKSRSFTEKVMRSDGKKAILEDFSTLDFTPVSVRKDEVVLSAAGVKNFDFLRITKRYSIQDKELVLDVTLQNLSDKAQSAGFWVRTMLRRDNGMGMTNTYFYPVNGSGSAGRIRATQKVMNGSPLRPPPRPVLWETMTRPAVYCFCLKTVSAPCTAGFPPTRKFRRWNIFSGKRKFPQKEHPRIRSGRSFRKTFPPYWRNIKTDLCGRERVKRRSCWIYTRKATKE